MEEFRSNAAIGPDCVRNLSNNSPDRLAKIRDLVDEVIFMARKALAAIWRVPRLGAGKYNRCIASREGLMKTLHDFSANCSSQ